MGEILDYDANTGLAHVLAKNRFAIGDRLEVITPRGNRELILDHIEGIDGQRRELVPGGGHEVRIPLPVGDYTFGLLAREETDG